MAFQSNKVFEDVFGFNVPGIVILVTKASANFFEGFGEVAINYYANYSAMTQKKAVLQSESYEIRGEAFAGYGARVAELNGDLYAPAYEYLRTVTNPDGSLKFPADQWIDVKD